MDTEKNAGGTRQIWFAAANSEHGFENHFPALFSAGAGADALYIVKGGPGTGKSGLMRRVARRAGEAGWQVVFLLCSSDPASLDGLLLTAPDGRTVGMLDGTAPHAGADTARHAGKPARPRRLLGRPDADGTAGRHRAAESA